MRLAVMLPTFQETPRDALAVAARAEASGLDGVFAFDHVWPMGSPQRPAIAPFEVLATVAVRHPGLRVGTLVARIGLVDDEVLLGQIRALRAVAEGGIIAALGTGDRKSREENLAYGVDFAGPDERRRSLAHVAATLSGEGTEVWIGDGAQATREVAIDTGCGLNVWMRPAADVRAAGATGVRFVTWGGVAPQRDGEVDEAATESLLIDLAEAGASWAVFGAPAPVEVLARISKRSGRRFGRG
jgi:hypothetical protein